MGPIYFLADAGKDRTSLVRRIVLFDPGVTSEMAEVTGWRLLTRPQTCDWQYDVNGLLANWLKSNQDNHLIVFTGRISEEKPGGNPNAEPTYAGLWKFWFADLWNQPFSDRALVCNYNEMEHKDVLRNFSGQVKATSFACPDGPGRTPPWNP